MVNMSKGKAREGDGRTSLTLRHIPGDSCGFRLSCLNWHVAGSQKAERDGESRKRIDSEVLVVLVRILVSVQKKAKRRCNS